MITGLVRDVRETRVRPCSRRRRSTAVRRRPDDTGTRHERTQPERERREGGGAPLPQVPNCSDTHAKENAYGIPYDFYAKTTKVVLRHFARRDDARARGV